MRETGLERCASLACCRVGRPLTSVRPSVVQCREVCDSRSVGSECGSAAHTLFLPAHLQRRQPQSLSVRALCD